MYKVHLLTQTTSLKGGEMWFFIPQDRFQRILLLGLLVFLALSCIKPPFMDFLLMQHVPTLVAIAFLGWLTNRVQLSRFSYSAIADRTPKSPLEKIREITRGRQGTSEPMEWAWRERLMNLIRTQYLIPSDDYRTHDRG